MKIIRKAICALLLISFATFNYSLAQVPTVAPKSGFTVDLDVMDKLRREETERSEIMQIASYLTNVIGGRLTGSPSQKRASDWTLTKLKEYGLENAQLESWGEFGRGWTISDFNATAYASNQAMPLIAYPAAWSVPTGGAVTGNVVYLDADDTAGLEKYKGKLKDAIVLIAKPKLKLPAYFNPLAVRRDSENLLREANTPDSEMRGAFQSARQKLLEARGEKTPAPADNSALTKRWAAITFNPKKIQFLVEQGAAAAISSGKPTDGIGMDGGTFVVLDAVAPLALDLANNRQSMESRPKVWSKNAAKNLPQIIVADEQYNRLAEMLKQGEQVKMTLNLAVEYQDRDPNGYNVIAEIPGSDPQLKSEIVMLGAHLDSFHTATGATDNAAGVAVMMEAARLIKKLNLPVRRTIRIALWSGEEQGRYGSEAYVKNHFAEFTLGADNGQKPKLALKSEYEKISAYYNLDNGTGKIRGIKTEENPALRPIFKEWLLPFAQDGANNVTDGGNGGTDHVSFLIVGIPGFQFTQDWVEYDTRTHHTNMDTFERLQEDDLKFNALIVAAFVYNTAMRDEKLPRFPQP